MSKGQKEFVKKKTKKKTNKQTFVDFRLIQDSLVVACKDWLSELHESMRLSLAGLIKV